MGSEGSTFGVPGKAAGLGVAEGEAHPLFLIHTVSKVAIYNNQQIKTSRLSICQ